MSTPTPLFIELYYVGRCAANRDALCYVQILGGGVFLADVTSGVKSRSFYRMGTMVSYDMFRYLRWVFALDVTRGVGGPYGIP